MAKPTVVLIPWDPNSTEHVERMVEQREACGWHAPLVATEWKKGHLAGKKCIYWVIIRQDEQLYEKYTKMHQEAFPKEFGNLLDTSQTLLKEPRRSTGTEFLPIGHIALDVHDPVYAEKLGLKIPKSGSYWIKSLYISYALQGLGVGRAAMDAAERMASEEPLNARHLLLDTVYHEDQSNEEFAMAIYGGSFKVPTQPWYERRGYRLIGTVENLYTDPDPSGKVWPCRTVFLQKDVA